MNLFNNKVTQSEEVDYDNQRLVYVNELVPVTTHSYEDHTLSTDQVISLFDGGYRFGVLEQLEFTKNQSREFEHQVLVLAEEFRKLMYEQNVNSRIAEGFIDDLKSIFCNYHARIEANLKKKFDICQYSSEERIRDPKVKEKSKDFLDQLFSSYGSLGDERGPF